ncbi:MAG: ParB/RepB/Spo0J family partition protein [Hyphomicrobiales bacterium]|nr:ParB/RepB/Spo0J family partition protein [Hyphomicrobiales bacterium]
MSDEQPNVTKSRLGRGLASLIGDAPKDLSSNMDDAPVNISTLPIEQIQANKQNPRSVFSEDELVDLANSIKEKGILQPIIVRQRGNEESYEVIAGERRWRAAQIAQLDNVPVIIKNLSDDDALEIAIIENVQRSNLNPIDEASGYKRLMDIYNYTQEDLSQVIGKSRSYIANILRLENLPLKVQEYLSSGKLTIGHARALILSEDAENLANLVISKGLSVRQTEELVKNSNLPASKITSKKVKDSNIKNLEKLMTDNLGLKVEIQTKDNKSGKVLISYLDNSQLDNIKKRLIS